MKKNLILKRFVEDRGLRPKDMANLFGVNERTWYNWSRDPETYITIGRLRTIAEALNLNDIQILELVKGKYQHNWK